MVVGDFIIIMMMTFSLILINVMVLNSMDTQKHGNKKKLSVKKAFLEFKKKTC